MNDRRNGGPRQQGRISRPPMQRQPVYDPELEELYRRRAAYKAKRMKQIRRRKTILAFVILIFLVAAAVGIVWFLNRNGQSNGTAANTGEAVHSEEKISENTGVQADAGTESQEPQESSTVLHLTEAEQYTGDLILVNATYPYHVEENRGVGLVDIAATKTGDYAVNYEGMQLAAKIMEPLDRMIAACEAETGSHLSGITSAHRSVEKQQQIFDEYTELYGSDYAQAYVAVPGYSEHHTGLAMDIGIFYPDGSEGYFSDSEEASWYAQNAHRFGFIRRYQENKVEITGINNEEWHFRYVGIPHAYYMHAQDLCLEEYLDWLRNHTSLDQPITVDCNGAVYNIYYTRENTVLIPEGCEYSVSGTNIDGYVITVRQPQI